MKSLWILFFLLVAPASGWCQISGPVIRDLGNQYFLVQCNCQQLQQDDLVSILRGGREVARGKVMRSQPGACTVLVEAGEVLRFDVVMLLKPVAAPSDRGPSIPCAIAPTRAKTLAPVAKSDKKDFWSTLNTNGRVYQLNTGQMLTP